VRGSHEPNVRVTTLLLYLYYLKRIKWFRFSLRCVSLDAFVNHRLLPDRPFELTLESPCTSAWPTPNPSSMIIRPPLAPFSVTAIASTRRRPLSTSVGKSPHHPSRRSAALDLRFVSDSTRSPVALRSNSDRKPPPGRNPLIFLISR
jgi:hypothetical protein